MPRKRQNDLTLIIKEPVRVPADQLDCRVLLEAMETVRRKLEEQDQKLLMKEDVPRPPKPSKQ